jgi:hypothetical protein
MDIDLDALNADPYKGEVKTFTENLEFEQATYELAVSALESKMLAENKVLVSFKLIEVLA